MLLNVTLLRRTLNANIEQKNKSYRNKKTKTQKEEKVVSQKNRLKMWTYINLC